MSKQSDSLFSLVSIGSLIIGMLTLIADNPRTLTFAAPTPEFRLGAWNLTIHGIHNAFYFWRDPPYSLLIPSHPILVPAICIALLLAVHAPEFTESCRAIITRVTHYKRRKGAGAPQECTGATVAAARVLRAVGWGLFVPLLMTILVGHDQVVWGIVFATLLLISGFSIAEPKRRLIVLTPLTFIAILVSSQYFGAALFLAVILIKTAKAESVAGPKEFLVLGVLSLAMLYSPPALPPLDYPEGARVTDWFQMPEFARPLIGPATPIPILNFRGYRDFSLVPLLLLLPVVLATCWYSNTRRHLLQITFVLAFWDMIPIRLMQEISPLQAVGRIVPNWGTYPLAWVALGALPLLLGIAIAECESLLLKWLCILTVPFLLLFGIITFPSMNQRFPVADMAKLAPESWYSPSRAILNTLPEQVSAALHQRQQPSAPLLSPTDIHLYASANNEKLASMLQPTEASRWSPGGGRQNGNEWVGIYADRPVKLSGVAFPSGKYSTDFPRGVTILAKSACVPEDFTNSSQWDKVIGIPQWMGPILFTPKGLPYFGPLHVVDIPFRRPVEVQCLLIKQTGIASENDWSITSITLYAPVASGPNRNPES
jgi:hypothetical protein